MIKIFFTFVFSLTLNIVSAHYYIKSIPDSVNYQNQFDFETIPTVNRLQDFQFQWEFDEQIYDLISQVNIDSLEYYVQTLQNFGTRFYPTTTCIEAQNWINEHFEKYNYDTELHTFYIHPGYLCPSKNVIAVKQGTTNPEQVVVCGSHYDSLTLSSFYNPNAPAPGADDNATGTAGMMEIARLLSEFDLGRTIIICAFTAEELGLYGSNEFASRCRQQKMDIIGYFNIDMSGYLHPGHAPHTHVIFPESARPLYNFYQTTTNMYIPEFEVSEGVFTGGDSDHTSFNKNGYMGIFPFEDEDKDYYSPYIHTINDVIGLSVNSFEQVKLFTQATLASVASMASDNYNVNIENNQISNYITIVPNPASSYFRIYARENINKIEIFNQLGQIVFSKLIENNNNVEIDTSQIIEGLYFVSIYNNNQIITKKVIISK